MTNPPNQVIPSFSSVYLLADQVIGAGVWTTILFDIIDTDGTNPGIYDPTTGEFTAPVSGWFDIKSQLRVSAISDLRIVKNGDINFAIGGRPTTSSIGDIFLRTILGKGETLRVEINITAGGTVFALAGTVIESRSSNIIFTLVKRFDDTKTF